MKLAIVYSRSSSGIHAPLVSVETDLSKGFPKFSIVGLPEATVKESKDRVRSALMNSGFEFPARRITVNLAPADVPKEGGRFDLPIALGILAASGQIPMDKLNEFEFTAELGLSGELRPVRGVLPVAIGAKKAGRCLVIAERNSHEAGLVKDMTILIAQHLSEVCAYLKGDNTLKPCPLVIKPQETLSQLDLMDVKGQVHAKRALMIAAAGKHSLLLMGPPGTGKTMLANRFPDLLPGLTEEQALEVASLFSVSSTGFDIKEWQKIPFRSPHHSSSCIALVGGGRPPRPGEISLAHQGVLFLDELPEYHRDVLESLREPLESGRITISRAAYQTVFPAEFQLIAAMNPCPCGYAGSPEDSCRCTGEQIQRYRGKLSGPLLDRIDLQIEVPRVPAEMLNAYPSPASESSETIRARVVKARGVQMARQGKTNAVLMTKEIDTFCALTQDSRHLLSQLMNRFQWSARVYHRLLKVARTIADLEDCSNIELNHLSEAFTYRCLDRPKQIL